MEGSGVKRRLIQSTLYPHRDPPPAKESDSAREAEVVEVDEDVGGSGKKRRDTKKKVSAKRKSPAAPSKKAMENGQGISEKQAGESESPVVAKSNFFVKASEKRQQKRQQSQPILLNSPERHDDICTPPMAASNEGNTPRKSRRRNKSNNSTPRKERTSTPNKKMKSGAKSLCFGQIPFDLNLDDQPSQTIPDLRLEEKQKAEEMSRMYSGKQIHPFFTSIKGGKSSQGSSSQEDNLSSFERKEKGITFNPIHVLENVEVDYAPLEWGDWVFSEKIAMDRPECGCSPVNEKSVATMNFDDFYAASPFNKSSLYQNFDQCSTMKTQVSDRLLDQPDSTQCTSSSSLVNKTVIWGEQKELSVLPNNILANSDDLMLLDHKPEMTDFFVRTSGNSVSELQEKLLQERIASHYHTSHSTPENCLWTDKYQPRSANQICGNGESVKYLSQWLHLWHQKCSRTSRNCNDNEVSLTQDIDSDYQQSDSDSDTIDGDNSLKNVLLVTGPVGCGKSAAIYSCARDEGFQVIEINASDWRSGALIKQKFGEAVESHWNQRAVETARSADKKAMSKYFTVVETGTLSPGNEVIELIDLSDKNDPQDATVCQNIPVSGEDRNSNCPNEIKTLILFEDVDITLCEDHGFLTTIQQLAETAKKPMILTSNSDNPALPKNMERSELNFMLPLREELLELVHMICAAEKIKLQPCLLERFVDYCEGDIRKTIMHLQFWSQGLTLGRGYGRHLTYSPVLFDLDAGHHILPKLIPWAYHSKLSELVDMEVVESLHLVEATHGSCDTNQGVDPINCIAVQNPNGLHDPFEAKKEAMLSLHHLFQDEAVCADFQDDYDLSGSPVKFARKNGRRKINAVLSDSDDEFLGCSTMVSDGLLDINVELEDMKGIPSSICLYSGVSHHPTEEIYNSQMEMVEEQSFHVNDVCRSPDMSFVPESSFVPETEFFNESDLHSASVSYGHFVDAEAKFVIPDQDPLPTPEPAASASQLNKFLNILHGEQEILANNSSASVAHMFQEEVGDSISKSVADFEVQNQCRILDECSRVDFRRLRSLSNCEAEKDIDYVHEAWKRLHDPCKYLRNYVTAEEKTVCQILKLAHGMSNLISEADLLLKDCQTVISDLLRPSLIPSEKVHSFSYCDNQLDMSSVLAQHGTCLYAKEITSLGSVMGSTTRLDLVSEMLLNSSSSTALGKLARYGQRNVDHLETGAPKMSNPLTSNTDSFCSILQSVVPSRSYLAAKGYAYHEYMSTLSQISRFEDSRISDCLEKRTQRRGRVARHYLSSGSLSMSSEEISLLGQYNSYQKVLGD